MARPSKYKPKYCEDLIAHMKQGLSFESFAAVIKVNQDTLHEWARRHKEFSEAKKIAFEENRLVWEKMGIAGMMGRTPGFNATVWIFNMKNRFKWVDRTEQKIEAEVTAEANVYVAKWGS